MGAYSTWLGRVAVQCKPAPPVHTPRSSNNGSYHYVLVLFESYEYEYEDNGDASMILTLKCFVLQEGFIGCFKDMFVKPLCIFNFKNDKGFFGNKGRDSTHSVTSPAIWTSMPVLEYNFNSRQIYISQECRSLFILNCFYKPGFGTSNSSNPGIR
ncbi:uncharacterized protein LOC131301779 [Rhododendron vialii]|uniref:uncharacterized protein LOC131301779 n=1 Tax=Rhododendron vialii TaxID=182163 RepID=UPI00265E77F6|nr:uncharacterized protein LOC131301779 [Rhododendron vialii]XP_058184197.1 uncharacterized protein LOC131301779 [Rhododendron vialii]XP_058184205.1 uncharacterized protein LOC131301779 [Rhododendron vialii]